MAPRIRRLSPLMGGTVDVMLDVRVPADGQLAWPMARDEFVRWHEHADLPYKVEWYDGLCIVTSPVRRHSLAVSELFRVLLGAVGTEMTVMAEAAWTTALGFFIPDLLVCHEDAPGDPYLTGTPLLVVEVLSPSTRRVDLAVKREHYAAAGLEWYWVVDPDAPSLTVFAVGPRGQLEPVQTIGPGQTATTVGPFAVAVTPERLVRRGASPTG